jgi:hypothetical protein
MASSYRGRRDAIVAIGGKTAGWVKGYAFRLRMLVERAQARGPEVMGTWGVMVTGRVDPTDAHLVVRAVWGERLRTGPEKIGAKRKPMIGSSLTTESQRRL